MTHSFEYNRCPISELPERDRELVDAARDAAYTAEAPFTGFGVGAAVRLHSGRVITSANRESPIGALSICAERRLLYALSNDDRIDTFAIAASTGGEECYPCGVCRQAMIEKEAQQEAPMRVIMAGRDTVTVVRNAADLLPFAYKY